MKNIPVLIVAVVAALSSITTQAQSTSDIIGQWQIDIDESINLMSTDVKSQFDSLSETARNQLVEGLLKQRFTFNADSTFEAGSVGAQFYNGTWTLAATDLVLTFASGAVRNQQIDVPGGDALIFILSYDGLFSSIYLKKSPSN